MVKVPSTLGTFLRSFRWGHVRQLDRVGRELLSRAWAAGAGPGDTPLTIDLDSTIRRWMLASDWLIMSIHCERRARSRSVTPPTAVQLLYLVGAACRKGEVSSIYVGMLGLLLLEAS